MIDNNLRDRIYTQAVEAGHWERETVSQAFNHAIQECSEACTALSSKIFACRDTVHDLTHNKTSYSPVEFKAIFKDRIHNTFEDEIADIVIMVLSIAGKHRYNVNAWGTADWYSWKVVQGSRDIHGQLNFIMGNLSDCYTQIVDNTGFCDGRKHINRILRSVVDIANDCAVDIAKHIELKLMYNLLR